MSIHQKNLIQYHIFINIVSLSKLIDLWLIGTYLLFHFKIYILTYTTMSFILVKTLIFLILDVYVYIILKWKKKYVEFLLASCTLTFFMWICIIGFVCIMLVWISINDLWRHIQIHTLSNFFFWLVTWIYLFFLIKYQAYALTSLFITDVYIFDWQTFFFTQNKYHTAEMIELYI